MPRNKNKIQHHANYIEVRDGGIIYFGTDHDASFTANGTGCSITGDVNISGDIVMGADDVSVVQGRYIYLSGQDGGEYLKSASSNTAIFNATTTLYLGIGGTAEIILTATAFSPYASDGNALGTTALMWGDIFLASGGVINFNNGNVTLTHSAGTLTMVGTLTFAGGSAYIPIQIGTKGNTSGSGVKIASANADNSGGVQLYFDDGGSALASPAEVVTPFRSRYLVTVGQSGGVTQAATYSQLRTLGTTQTPLVLNTGIWESAYIFNQLGGNTIQGGAVILGINQATTLAGNMIVTSGEFAGIDINIAGTGTITNNSTCAALLIRSSGTPVWPNGIQIANNGAVTGILIGTGTTNAIQVGTQVISDGSGNLASANGTDASNVAVVHITVVKGIVTAVSGT